MKKKFCIKDMTGEMAYFTVSVTKSGGLEYEYISGKASPTWQDVVGAATYIFSKMRYRTSFLDKYVKDDGYTVYRDNKMDVRAVPVLFDMAANTSCKLPLTVEYDEILEHYFHIPFYTAVKVMLALTMSYGPKVLMRDPEKLPKLDARKRSVNGIEVMDV